MNHMFEMYTTVSLVIFLAMPTTVLNQLEPIPIKPDKCMGTDKVMERHCCIFPPFFNHDVSRECGGRLSLREINKIANITILRRETPQCEYWQCVLNKYAILRPDGSVSEDKFYTHLDKWTALNIDFNTIMLSAKAHCRHIFRLFDVNSCEFFKLLSCVRHFINVDCPKIIRSKECFEWKEFYDECRDFYL